MLAASAGVADHSVVKGPAALTIGMALRGPEAWHIAFYKRMHLHPHRWRTLLAVPLPLSQHNRRTKVCLIVVLETASIMGNPTTLSAGPLPLPLPPLATLQPPRAKSGMALGTLKVWRIGMARLLDSLTTTIWMCSFCRSIAYSMTNCSISSTGVMPGNGTSPSCLA